MQKFTLIFGMTRKLVENPVIDNPYLKYTYDFAKRKHDDTGVVRKSTGQPYFIHPEMVADIVAVYDGTTTEIEAALLHDTLEDTDTTAEELEAVYGPDVAQIVEEVTNFQPEVDRLGKEEYINQELLELSPSALLVKAADCLANSLDHPKPGQAERIARNFAYMLEFRDDIPDNVRRLIKSLPLMDDYDLDKPEFEDSLDDYENELVNHPCYLVASRNMSTDKERLQEGKKLKAFLLGCILALGGMTGLDAEEATKSQKQNAVEAIAKKNPTPLKIKYDKKDGFFSTVLSNGAVMAVKGNVWLVMNPDGTSGSGTEYNYDFRGELAKEYAKACNLLFKAQKDYLQKVQS